VVRDGRGILAQRRAAAAPPRARRAALGACVHRASCGSRAFPAAAGGCARGARAQDVRGRPGVCASEVRSAVGPGGASPRRPPPRRAHTAPGAHTPRVGTPIDDDVCLDPPLSLPRARSVFSSCVQMFHQLTMLKEVIAAARPVPPRPAVFLPLLADAWNLAVRAAAPARARLPGACRGGQTVSRGPLQRAAVPARASVAGWRVGPHRSWCRWGMG